MNLIAEITDATIGAQKKKVQSYRLRRAARAVLMDGQQVALMHSKKYHYHKLPGGGMDEGETIQHALKREVKEETGCTIQQIKPLGLVIEYRDHFELLQLSYCFLTRVKKKGKKNELTEKEKKEEFEVQWMPLSKAIKALQKDQPSTYGLKFMNKRDLVFLKAAQKIKRQKS